MAASTTLTAETTSAITQFATSLHALIAAPSAVPMPTMPAVATTRTNADSRTLRCGFADRKPLAVRASVLPASELLDSGSTS